MNEHDKNNLNFILSLSDKARADFYDQCDVDDLQYAKELIQVEMSNLFMMELEFFDQVEDTELADRAILDIFDKFDTK